MTVEAAVFTCNICGEPSKDICAYCTKDACANHRCERCKRCSDCCECDEPLSAVDARLVEEPHAPEQQIEAPHAGPQPIAAETLPDSVETEPAAPETNEWFKPSESFTPPEEPEQ
jgi:hypothetical protein